jgi:hypothetical protein
LALTNTAFTTASNAVIEADSVLASTVDFPAKTTAVEASKQANAAFKVEIQALDAVKRDQDDGVIVTTFNNQHQALKTQITELEVARAAAIEAKRVADLAAQWEVQLALTNTALTTASNAVIEASSVLARARIAILNAALACFDASTAVVLEDNSASLFITLVALATTVFAVIKAESVNANCACHGAERSAARFASIAAASATSSSVIRVFSA